MMHVSNFDDNAALAGRITCDSHFDEDWVVGQVQLNDVVNNECGADVGSVDSGETRRPDRRRCEKR